jgi:hypothetical protein
MVVIKRFLLAILLCTAITSANASFGELVAIARQKRAITPTQYDQVIGELPELSHDQLIAIQELLMARPGFPRGDIAKDAGTSSEEQTLQIITQIQKMLPKLDAHPTGTITPEHPSDTTVDNLSLRQYLNLVAVFGYIISHKGDPVFMSIVDLTAVAIYYFIDAHIHNPTTRPEDRVGVIKSASNIFSAIWQTVRSKTSVTTIVGAAYAAAHIIFPKLYILDLIALIIHFVYPFKYSEPEVTLPQKRDLITLVKEKIEEKHDGDEKQPAKKRARQTKRRARRK